jgi:predicted transcriptional regulator
VTHVWADDFAEEPLLEALSMGRAYFARPAAFSGTIDVEGDGDLRMGSATVDGGARQLTATVSGASPGDTVRWPAYSDRMDYELEVGAVIGKRGTDIPAGEAGTYVAGYTVRSEGSRRDARFDGGQLFRGRRYETFAETSGPEAVEQSEITEQVDMSRGPVSRILGELEEEDIIERYSPAGQHGKSIELTEQGEKLESLVADIESLAERSIK